MKLSEKILDLRKQNHMSQEELAEKLHVSRQAISRWEGASAQPDASNILQLSKLFRVTADYLLNDDYEPNWNVRSVENTEAVLGSKDRTVEKEEEEAVSGGKARRDEDREAAAGSKARPVKSADPAPGSMIRKILAIGVSVFGALGNLTIYIVSRFVKVVIPYITYQNGRKRYTWDGSHRGYHYLYFVQEYHLEFLIVLFWIFFAGGILVALLDRTR